MTKPETILKQIAHQHGITILAQSRLKGLILDMMPTAERKHINVLKRAIDDQIGSRLLEMQHDEPAVRQIKINTLKKKFKNDNAFDDTAFYIVDCFVQALGWDSIESDIILPFKEIKIGNQIWADRNLDVSHFLNGNPIPEARTREEWKEAGEKKQPAWCYFENDPENGKKYGKLYNCYAVNDPRGLAPAGWHVASDDEWTELTDFIGGKDIAGLKLKSVNGWYKDGNGIDEYSFSALPSGTRWFNGNFGLVGPNGYWWSSTEDSTTNAWSWNLGSDRGSVSRNYGSKRNGFSVRCLRDN